MRTYKIFHPLWLSFYSKSLYRDIGQNWKGLGFLYLFFLLTLTWLPVAINTHLETQNYRSENAEKIIEQFPTVVIQNGEAHTDVEMPYIILDPETTETLFVIDTTGEINSLEETSADYLITRTRFIARQSRGRSRSFEFQQLEDFTINQENIWYWVNAFVNWFATVLYLLAVPFSFAYRILQVLLYGAIGLLFAKGEKASLDYVSLVRLATVAITPGILLDTIVWVTHISIPGWFLLSFILAMVYLYFGVKANVEPETTPPSAPVEAPPAL